jgi:hypothetical protein
MYIVNTDNNYYELCQGHIYAVDLERNLVSVVTNKQSGNGGSILQNVRPLSGYVDDDGNGTFIPPKPGTPCLVAIFQSGAAYDAFVVGYYQNLNHGTSDQSPNLGTEIGDMVYRAGKYSYLLLRKSGIIEIKANPYCHTVYKPISSTLYTITKNYELFRDHLNKFTIHEKDGEVVHEHSAWADINQFPLLEEGTAPQIITRIGKTRAKTSKSGYEDFSDDSLIKTVVRTVDDSGNNDLSKVIFAVGKIPEDKTSVRITAEDYESKSSFSVSVGKKDSGEIIDLSAKDEENSFDLKVGSMEDAVVKLGVNEDKLNLSIDKEGKVSVVNPGASLEIDKDGNINILSAKTTTITSSGAVLKLGDSKVGLGSGSNELVDLCIKTIEAIINAPMIGVSSQGPVKIAPPLKQKLSQLKGKLNEIKGGI